MLAELQARLTSSTTDSFIAPPHIHVDLSAYTTDVEGLVAPPAAADAGQIHSNHSAPQQSVTPSPTADDAQYVAAQLPRAAHSSAHAYAWHAHDVAGSWTRACEGVAGS